MDEDLKSASASVAEQDKPAYRPANALKPRRKIPVKLLITLFILVLLAGSGFAVWKFMVSKPKAKPATQAPVTITQTEQIAEDVPDADSTETYNSEALSVSFKYPKHWKVTEADKGIRVESPEFTYPAVQQGSTQGIFRVYIRQGAREIDGKYIGDGVAIKPSEKLTYTQPAIGQRTETLLSSFGFNSTDIFSFFLIAGNFQLNTGDTLGPDYGKEADTYIVAGGYTTTTAIDELGMQSVAIDYYDTTNAYKQALAIIASVQLK
jgi:hypothetical protein